MNVTKWLDIREVSKRWSKFHKPGVKWKFMFQNSLIFKIEYMINFNNMLKYNIRF